MKSCRLIFTEHCNRNCSYCCNEQYNFNDYHEWKWSKVNEYDLLVISGGEPMLYPNSLSAFVKRFRILENRASYPRWHEPTKIILYTAYVKSYNKISLILKRIDGLTVTLHKQEDVEDWLQLNNHLIANGPYGKSLRLSVFDYITIPSMPFPLWNIQQQRITLDKCPVPEDDMLVMRNNYER